MLKKTYVEKLKRDLHEYALIRRDVIKNSDDAIHHAKRAVFDLHRGDIKAADEKLREVEKLMKELNKKYKKTPEIQDEGTYMAALEEYVEASLFYQFVIKGDIGEVKGLPVTGEVFLAGLCDVPGELFRYAIRAATNHDIATAQKCNEVAGEIIGELMEFNLTKYLRNKFDQARQAAHKLEMVVYEVTLRQKNS
jgi:translin